MSHRMAVEDLLYRRNIANTRVKGPSLSQEELDEQVNRFLAAGGRIQAIPVGQSAHVIQFSAKPPREDSRKPLRRKDEINLEDSVGTDYILERIGGAIATVREMVRRDNVPHFFYGRHMRFRQADVDEWLERREA